MPAVCRVTDTTTGHDCYPETDCVEGSPDVFDNGLAVCRVGDAFREHCCTDFPFDCHTGTLSQGSPTYQANGKAVGRVGDPLSCGDTVATGSPDCIVD